MYKTGHTIDNTSKKTLRVMIMFMAFMVILSSIAVVSAIPPFTTQQSTNTLQIESPSLPVIHSGHDRKFHAHVINATSIKTNKTTTCALHLYNSSSFDIHTPTQWMSFEDYPNGLDFVMTVKGGNFSNSGIYAYVIGCNSSNEVGFFRGQFAVTPNGEIADTGTAVFYIGLLGVLLFFLAITIFSFAEFENLLNRVGMIGIGYLLLMAITFIGWNMAQDFLTSSPFIISMLRILFFVFIVGFFPLVIGGFIWYFLQLWKIKEIEGLMTKGMPEHEAKRRVERR